MSSPLSLCMMNAAATEASLSHLLVNVVSSPFFLDTPRELQRITERDLFHLSPYYYSSPLYDFSMIERINHWKQVEELFVKSLSSCRKWTHTQNLVNSVLITFF